MRQIPYVRHACNSAGSRWGALVSLSGVAALAAATMIASLLCAAEPTGVATDADRKLKTTPGAKAGRRATDAPAPGVGANREPQRFREGHKLVDEVGYFTLSGDRATFYTVEGGLRLGGLENLNLERVVQRIDDSSVASSPNQLRWQVNGIVTEYRGSNYLLVTRAILLSKPNDAAGRR
jgi:hypothetical protein